MNMEDACLLAAEIERNYPRVSVIAVGRFLPPEDLRPGSPWKISVAVEGDQRLKVIASEAEARTLRYVEEDKQQRLEAGFLF
jgi:hypothetical protein